MDLNKTFCFSSYVCILQNNNKYLIANRENDKRVILSLEVYGILLEAIEKKKNILRLLEEFELVQDKEYLLSLFEKLYEAEMIVEQNKRNLKNDAYESATLMLTEQCNLSCIHCCQNAQKEKKSNGLSTEEWVSIIEKVIRMGVKTITITGGEALLRKDIKIINQYLRKNFKGEILLLTNGTLINKKNVDSLIQTYDHISISIDGCNEELTRFIRGKGVYEKVLEVINLLHKKEFYNISLSAILPSSIEVEKEFEVLCSELKVSPQIRYLTKMGRAGKNFEIMQEKFKKYINERGYTEYLFENQEDIADLRACTAIRNKNITVGSTGNIYPCNLLHENKYTLGNIDNIVKNRDFEKLINFEGTICADCCVNVFCWSCISDFALIKDKEALLKERCKNKRENLIKRVWGETDVDNSMGNKSV